MEIIYDKETDSLYIELNKGEFAKNKKVDDRTVIDMDSEDNILGIEILDASKRLTTESLSEVKVKNFLNA